MKQAPWINDVIKTLPEVFVGWLLPPLASFHALRRTTREQVEKVMALKNEDWCEKDHPTIFHAILDSKLPPAEKSVKRLSEEAQVLVMAGTLTTASALELITFWLLKQPDMLRKLKKELHTVMPSVDDVGKVPLATLESLPYLTAVIKEGLRLSYGLSARSQRIDPDNAIEFTDKDTGRQWVIPPRTPVSINIVQVHHDENIFPGSKEFSAERWLGDGARSLDKYLLSFSKGSRNCLGMNLAYGELYLTLAHVWRTWGSREATLKDDVGVLCLFETDRRDVEMESDHFIPTPQNGSQGIRVKAFNV